MLTPEDVTRLHAESHPLVQDGGFASVEELCLHLIHLKAYDRAAGLARGKAVLDLGCNNGYGSARIAGVAASVVGVDVSPKAVEAARARAGGNLEFRVVDGHALPFRDAAFDVVTSFQVIEHVADAASYLREIARVLRPGGVALLTTPNAALRLDPGQPPWNPFHVREYRWRELLETLRPHFRDVRVEGLFATELLEAVERQRVGRARDGARAAAAAGGGPVAALKAVARERLPPTVLRALRTIVHGRPPAPPRELPQLSLDDLHWRDDRLDDALDLLAECST